MPGTRRFHSSGKLVVIFRRISILIAIFLVTISIFDGHQLHIRLVENVETQELLVWLKRNDVALENGWTEYVQFSDNKPLQYVGKCEAAIDSSEKLTRVHTWNTLRTSDPQLILSAFEKAHCQYGEIFSVHFLRLLEANGRILLEKGQYVEAIERMRNSQASLWSIRREHRSFLPPFCIKAFQSGRLEEAELFCDAYDEASESVASAVMLGRVYLAEERLQDARFVFLKAIERDTLRFEGYFWLGRTEQLLGNYDEAVIAYRYSLELEPQNEEAWLALIKTRLDMGNIEMANAVLHEAVPFLNEINMNQAKTMLEER